MPIWNDRGVRSGAGEVSSMSATVRGVLLAAVVGFVVLFVTGSYGHEVFAEEPVAERVVPAKVVESTPCTEPNPTEKVTVTLGEEQRDATLSACGHEKGEKLNVVVPAQVPLGALTVRSAQTVTGFDSVRRSIGLGLMSLACMSGGLYAWLVTRRRRRAR
ncbi:MAG: hypothetical protein DIU77_014190 [Thermocrispum agreste]|uniref:Uncharacterized protein n=2 Tax=Pseudonocardiaceae TaxID=2070 RepID=A0ABD6FHP2_9PSEU